MRVTVYLRSESDYDNIHTTFLNVTNITHNQTDDIISILHRSEILAQLYFPEIKSFVVSPDKKEDAKP